MKIVLKILLLITLLNVISLSVLGYVSIANIKEIGEQSTEDISYLGESISKDSREALCNLGSELIKQKAHGVAKELEIYIKSHPDMTVNDLQNDDYFKSLAVQPVGKMGYTAVTDVDSLTCRFHKSEKTIDLDLHTLSEKLPGFWEIMSKTEGGYDSYGYYDWEEPDGSIKKKYMYIAVVNATTADNVKLSVAATTYIDEFSSPSDEMENKINDMTEKTASSIESTSQKIKIQIIGIGIGLEILIILLGLFLTKSIVKPIKSLTKYVGEISTGKFDAQIESKIKNLNDEIGDLARSFESITVSLKMAMRNVKKKETE